MSNVMDIVGQMKQKLGPNDLPKLMKVMSPVQIASAMAAFTATKKNDEKGALDGAKKLVATMTGAQRTVMVEILGEDLVKKLETL